MDLTPFRPQRIQVMGEPIDLVTCDQVMDFVARKVESGQKAVIVNHNSHSLALIGRHRAMRALYDRADLIEADSAPLIFWGKLLGKPIRHHHRCTYLNWRGRFWALAQAGRWRVFYLGGAPGVAARAGERLRHIAPEAEIAVRDGYFDMTPGSAENSAVVEAINRFRPHVLLVGMGMPRQEQWLEHNYDALDARVLIPVGAAFDYEAGVQKAAPRWTGRFGVEWAFRFVHDPTRLFHRYFIEPWRLIPAAVRDLTASRA
jgi:N-acetylglucosaminyldiphosphoundecaprenol N-acetyl-beta-D-mannosaminyltransferase